MLRSSLAVLLLASPALAAPPVTAIAYRDDGKLLAAGSRGTVNIVDPDKGDLVGELPGQTSRVTGLAFSKAGLLAVASGDAGKSGLVRIYDLAAGKPTNPLAEFTAHKDIVYAITFSPDGTTLATAGYDRLIHLWDVPPKATPRLTLKDHSDTVYALSFHPDGKLLASGSADRAVKVWDTATGKRLYTLSDPTDWVYAVAWAPDGKNLSAAGIDKSIRVWSADAVGGKLVNSAFAHEAAILKLMFPKDGNTLYSVGEDRVVKAWNPAKLVETKVFAAQPETVLSAALRPDGQQLAVGRFDGVLQLLSPDGKLIAAPLPVKPKPLGMQPDPAKDRFPFVAESGSTDSAKSAQKITLPATVAGVLDRAGDADFYRFTAKAGDQIGVQLVTTAERKDFDPVVFLADEAGEVLAEGTAAVGHVCAKSGTFAVGVRDREYRGGVNLSYRLHVGPVPVVTSVFPLGVRRGVDTGVSLKGVNLLGKAEHMALVSPPPTAVVGSKFAVPLPDGLKDVAGVRTQVVIGEFPVSFATSAKPLELPTFPGTVDGILSKPDETHVVRFNATKGKPLIVEVHAAQLGSPVDSALEIVDSEGKPVQRATLRTVAKTYTTLRDHGSFAPGIRIETWNELAVNDLLYSDGELMRIKALPKNPDDDCQFFQEEGRRLGFLDTTPKQHAMGVPFYKVEVHPPGATFPPNGMPVFRPAYRNDDGGPGYGKDSRIVFDPPSDGTYAVRISDATGAGGPSHAYRLTVREPRPDFTVKFSPESPKVWRGGGVPITVTATRIDGYDGPIDLAFADLPTPLVAPKTQIEAGQTTTVFTLFASAAGEKLPALKLVGTAAINGKSVVHATAGGKPAIIEPGDLATATNLSEVTLKPGGEARLIVKIERRNGFAGRVPLEVRGLPHGVRVLNIGLNGILVNPNQTEREIVLYADSWVSPIDHPIVVLSRVEKKNTEHAAASVLLKVR